MSSTNKQMYICTTVLVSIKNVLHFLKVDKYERLRCFLLLQFAVLLFSNLVCQGAIFAYLFLETKEVSNVIDYVYSFVPDMRERESVQCVDVGAALLGRIPSTHACNICAHICTASGSFRSYSWKSWPDSSCTTHNY